MKRFDQKKNILSIQNVVAFNIYVPDQIQALINVTYNNSKPHRFFFAHIVDIWDTQWKSATKFMDNIFLISSICMIWKINQLL